MIDIHTHILPQMDDGPSDWQDTLNLLRQGAADGIRGAVCTSHILNQLDENLESKLLFKFEQLKELAKKDGLQISLWLGSEIHTHSDFNPVSKVATFNGNGKYIMIEFPMNDLPPEAAEQFFNLSLQGITPILAHPERNAQIMQKPERAFEFVQRGALLQVNAGSLTGKFGRSVRKAAFQMISHNMVHFVASDCHHVKSRPMLMSGAYKVVKQRWGVAVAQKLFRQYPFLAIKGDPIEAADPIPFVKRKWFSLR